MERVRSLRRKRSEGEILRVGRGVHEVLPGRTGIGSGRRNLRSAGRTVLTDGEKDRAGKLPHCFTKVGKKWGESSGVEYSATSPRVFYADGGRFLKVMFACTPAQEWNREMFGSKPGRKKRGVCKGFSFGSRRKMLDRINQISVAADLPTFVTLTFPDDCFDDSVTSFAVAAKWYLDVWFKRLRRACPSACGLWRMQWESRKSGLYPGKLFPHFHLLLWGLPERVVGQRLNGELVFEPLVPVRDCQRSLSLVFDEVKAEGELHFRTRRSAERFGDRAFLHEVRSSGSCSQGSDSWMGFFDWASLAWYHVVGSHNLSHFLAGCSVSKCRTWGGALFYCARYMGRSDAENFMAGMRTGRSWGIFNRASMPWGKMIELPLEDELGIRLRRIACRYLSKRLGRRVQRHYGFTLYCDVSQWKRLLESSPPDPF